MMSAIGLLDFETPSHSDGNEQDYSRSCSDMEHILESLKKEYNDVEEVFHTVEDQLRNAPEIGGRHPLLEKWDDLHAVRTFEDFALDPVPD